MSKDKTKDTASAYYRFMVQYAAQHGYSPTVREIKEHFGMTSTSVVVYYLDLMTKWGWIKRDKYTARSIQLLHTPDKLPAAAESQSIEVETGADRLIKRLTDENSRLRAENETLKRRLDTKESIRLQIRPLTLPPEDKKDGSEAVL